MRQALGVLTGDAQTRTQRLQHAHEGGQKPRVPRRDLLAGGPGHTRQAVARLLGVRRHPVGHRRALDASGGLEAWLALSVPAGTPRSLPPGVPAAMAPPRRQPAGFASYEALRQWGSQPHPLDGTAPPLDTLVRTTGKAKRKGPRPSHPPHP